MTVSIKRWCTPTWIKWTSRAKTLFLRCGCSWKAFGSPERPRKLTGSWRNLQQDILNAIRGEFSSPGCGRSRIWFCAAHICDINIRSVFPIQILQANPLCQCWHCVRPCLLNHYADNRPPQSTGKHLSHGIWEYVWTAVIPSDIRAT